MLREALFEIIQQEYRETGDRIRRERSLPHPDTGALSRLQSRELDLRRELESFPDR